MSTQLFFQLLRAALFTNENVDLQDWECVFKEMKQHTVAALPGEWLKTHPISESWSIYCHSQQGRWIRIMHEQDNLITLLESNNIPSVIIKGSAAAMYYPHPSLRSMGDVDILVRRTDFNKAAKLLEQNGYSLSEDKEHVGHHYNYSKDNYRVELHKRLPVIDDADEELLQLFEKGIENREWHETGMYSFPTLPRLLNGLVLIFHINQHLREGIGVRQIIDWMMFVDKASEEQWNELLPILRSVGMERLALTVTAMCQRYMGLKMRVEESSSLPIDSLMIYIVEKGNFGRKAGIDGKTAAFALSSTERGGFFRRLQKGGVDQWEAAKRHPIIRPFAWIYQSFRIISILTKNKISLQALIHQRKKGIEQRQLIEALGLRLDKTIQTNGEINT